MTGAYPPRRGRAWWLDFGGAAALGLAVSPLAETVAEALIAMSGLVLAQRAYAAAERANRREGRES